MHQPPDTENDLLITSARADDSASTRRGPSFLKVAGYLLAGYLVLTAFYGFQMGRQIYQAKANPLLGIGAAIIGRDATESFAIQEANLPGWIIDSPTFWLALRISE
jgi:hypothetical protein